MNDNGNTTTTISSSSSNSISISSNNNSWSPRSSATSSSLLAKALDIPSLSHNNNHHNGNSSSGSGSTSASSSSASPCAANPCCGEDFEDNIEDFVTQRSPPYEGTNSANLIRSLSTSDTPVIKNRKVMVSNSNFKNSNANDNDNDNDNENPASREQRLPISNNSNNNSIQSMSESSVGTNTSSSLGAVNSSIWADNAPRHSDYTITTSNIFAPPTTHNGTNGASSNNGNINININSNGDPPLVIRPSSLVIPEPATTTTAARKRSILGNTVGKKYHCSEYDRSTRSAKMIPTPKYYGSIPPPMLAVVTTPGTTLTAMTPLSSNSASMQQQQQQQQQSNGGRGGDSTFTMPQEQQQQHDDENWQAPPKTAQHTRSGSRMIPRVLPVKQYADYGNYDVYYDNDDDEIIAAEDQNSLGGSADHHNRNIVLSANGGELRDLLPKHSSSSHRHKEFRKSVHAQSLLVGLAFMVVWLPNNAMAPNLTQMAGFYGMNEAERDLYLGSYCALALGVFSLPLSGLIGFMADFYSRKYLFLACCVLGALSSAWSGWAPNYPSLFLARLCSGGCMSGSVPVAFSLLGDLFSKEERNAASSGLTSMMGMGILLGQVLAGEAGPSKSWQYPFYVSAFVQLIMAFVIALWVEEPLRGGKEKALQGVFQSGNKYDRQLTMQGFIDAMHKNSSNWILLWQGFLTSLPWGIVFTFLNDYLSQEKGFSVEEATLLVMDFGVGCAIGGITGGYFGQLFMRGNRSYLPLFMAATTILGIFPFLAMLNYNAPDGHNGFRFKIFAVVGGCVASLPSVNVRPCIINVNPPESRGAALTAANLFVTLGRGIGPCCIVLLGSMFNASRQTAFNITLSVFWLISGIQLLFLAKALPKDQDAMEEELARYAASAAAQGNDESGGCFADVEGDLHGGGDGGDHPKSPVRVSRNGDSTDDFQPGSPVRRSSVRDDEDKLYESIISSPFSQYMTIDGKSARESLQFVKLGIQEFGDEIIQRNAHCRGCDTISPCDSQEDVRTQQLDNEYGDDHQHTDSSNEDASTTLLPIDGEVLVSEDDEISQQELQRLQDMWKWRHQQQHQTK
jgi:MFS family permease